MSNDDPPLSDYEILRATNIARNNARLRALGLISAAEEKASNASSRSSSSSSFPSILATSRTKATSGVKRKHPTKQNKALNQDPAGDAIDEPTSRKSLRLQGMDPKKERRLPPPTDVSEEGNALTNRMEEERAARVQECRDIRLRRALEVSDEGADKAAAENPTASYEHCLMRVRTMTEKGLANRVKSIERAAGKHCVVKMAIFKSCLQDEGRWDLAELAAAALERLKALQPPVD
jgi:hypothetical protein